MRFRFGTNHSSARARGVKHCMVERGMYAEGCVGMQYVRAGVRVIGRVGVAGWALRGGGGTKGLTATPSPKMHLKRRFMKRAQACLSRFDVVISISFKTRSSRLCGAP